MYEDQCDYIIKRAGGADYADARLEAYRNTSITVIYGVVQRCLTFVKEGGASSDEEASVEESEETQEKRAVGVSSRSETRCACATFLVVEVCEEASCVGGVDGVEHLFLFSIFLQSIEGERSNNF